MPRTRSLSGWGLPGDNPIFFPASCCYYCAVPVPPPRRFEFCKRDCYLLMNLLIFSFMFALLPMET